MGVPLRSSPFAQLGAVSDSAWDRQGCWSPSQASQTESRHDHFALEAIARFVNLQLRLGSADDLSLHHVRNSCAEPASFSVQARIDPNEHNIVPYRVASALQLAHRLLLVGVNANLLFCRTLRVKQRASGLARGVVRVRQDFMHIDGTRREHFRPALVAIVSQRHISSLAASRDPPHAHFRCKQRVFATLTVADSSRTCICC